MKKQISPKIVSLIFAILVICFAIAFYVVASWDEPGSVPPTGNVPAPLNVSNNPQIKSGSLRLGGLTVDNDTLLATSAGNVGIGTTSPSQKLDVDGYIKGRTGLCIGNDCRSSWPSGGGGVTSLSAGTGITLNPNPITSTGTISANTTYLQRRVTGTCAAGSSIRVINANGSVTCEPDDVGAAGLTCTTVKAIGNFGSSVSATCPAGYTAILANCGGTATIWGDEGGSCYLTPNVNNATGVHHEALGGVQWTVWVRCCK